MKVAELIAELLALPLDDEVDFASLGKKARDAERFMSRLDRSGECWLWTKSRNAAGYGTFGVGKKTMLAHRWAYEHFVGPIAEGLELDHACVVPACVNPAHLDPVTHEENLRRSFERRGIGASATHCSKGHALTPDNLRPPASGGSRCWKCHRDYHNAYQAKWRLRKLEELKCA